MFFFKTNETIPFTELRWTVYYLFYVMIHYTFLTVDINILISGLPLSRNNI